MSNRNFDSRTIIQRLTDLNNAQNLYRYQKQGIQSIRNPQTSDSSSSRINSYERGQQTTYYKNLIGGGYTSSIGGVANILAENVPIINNSSSPSGSVPNPPVITSIVIARDGTLQIFFTKSSDGGFPITDYRYNFNGGSYTSYYPEESTTDPNIFVLLYNNLSSLPSGTYNVTIIAVNINGVSLPSNIVPFTK
jgi:hypothetical protein